MIAIEIPKRGELCVSCYAPGDIRLVIAGDDEPSATRSITLCGECADGPHGLTEQIQGAVR